MPDSKRAGFFKRSLARAVALSDQVVTAAAPEAGLRRMAFRARANEFSYDAAHPEGRRGNSGGQFKNGAAESWSINRDRIKLIWEARDAEKNFAFIFGVLSKVSMYVCSKIMYQPATGDDDLNELYANYFHDWCQRADVAGRMGLREMVELAFRSMLRDGDCGFNIIEEGEELRLQFIEADRIGSPIDAQQTETYIGGFTIDEVGKIVSVRVYDRTRFNQYVNPQEIDPENFIHLFMPHRADQYRGITALATALPHARDIYEWFATEKQAGKTASLFAAFVLPKDPFKKEATGNPNGVDWDSDEPDGIPKHTPSFKAKAGMVVQLENGEKVEFPNIPSRPSGAFLSFVQVLVREIAIGMNLPYGFIYNMQELGGNTSRVEVMQAVRVIRRYQDMLVDKMLERIKNLVIARAIAFGNLPPCQLWREGTWQFGPELTGDVGYQTTADIARIKAGGKAIDDWTGEGGYTGAEIALKNAHYWQKLQKISIQTGIPIELLNPDLAPNATQALAAMATPPPPPPKDLLSKVAGGAKDVKPLLDIIGMYGRGETDRDGAIETTIVTYDGLITREDAEGMFPEKSPPALKNVEDPPEPVMAGGDDPIKRKGKK